MVNCTIVKAAERGGEMINLIRIIISGWERINCRTGGTKAQSSICYAYTCDNVQIYIYYMRETHVNA